MKAEEVLLNHESKHRESGSEDAQAGGGAGKIGMKQEREDH